MLATPQGPHQGLHQGSLPNLRNHLMQSGRPMFPAQQPLGFPQMAAFGPPFNLPIPGAPPMPWPQNQNLQPGMMGPVPQMQYGQPRSRAPSADRSQAESSRTTEPSMTSRNATPSPSNGQTTPFQAPTPPGATINRSQWRISVNQSFAAPNTGQNGQQLPPGTSANLSLPQNSAHLHNLHQLNHIQNMLVANMSSRFQPPRVGVNAVPSSSSTQTVYLLSSPSGPEALLLSPSGAFATPGYPMMGPLPFQLGAVQPQPSGTGRIGLQPQDLMNQPNNNQAGDAVPGANAPQAQANQAPNQQQDQVGEFLRILLPLGGHLWLLIRLCGFVYLFSSSWRNTILLGLCAFIVFVAQTRIFEPLLQHIWVPIRQHVEGLIQANPPPAPAGNMDNAGTADRGSSRTPQQLANRLVAERRAQQGIIRRSPCSSQV